MQAENREAHPSNSTVEAVNRPADGAAESNEGAERLSAEQLRAVAEEVRGAFPHPFQGCELLLVDVDPYQLHAFWSVPLSAIQTAQQRLGLASEQASMVLRLFDLSRAGGDDGTPFDVPVGGLQSQCYIDIWGKGRRLRGELGLLAADGS